MCAVPNMLQLRQWPLRSRLTTLVALWRGSMSVSFCLSRSRASGSSSYALCSSLKCESCSALRLEGVNTTCSECALLWRLCLFIQPKRRCCPVKTNRFVVITHRLCMLQKP